MKRRIVRVFLNIFPSAVENFSCDHELVDYSLFRRQKHGPDSV